MKQREDLQSNLYGQEFHTWGLIIHDVIKLQHLMNGRGCQSHMFMNGQRYCELNAQGGSIDKVTSGQHIGIMGKSWLMGSDWEDEQKCRSRNELACSEIGRRAG